MSYTALSAVGASPIELIVRLYERVISDLGRAVIAIRDGDVEKRGLELQHALAIIGQLQACLDMDRGGDPAQALDRFYSQAQARIVTAQHRQSGKLLEELARDFILLRDTWEQVDQAERPPSPPPDSSGDWIA
jgi:flagellar protein FliS